MFGATGDQKSDVEKNPKKNWNKLRITNDNQFLTVLKTVHRAQRTVSSKSWNIIENRAIAVFGATGDQKSDVEKTPKKIWQKRRITNDIQFLTALKTVYGARRTSWTNSIENRLQISLSRWFIEIAYVDFDEKNLETNFELFSTQKILER